MHVYIASRYSRFPEMQVNAEILQEEGHIITSRWIWGGHEMQDGEDRHAYERRNEEFAIEDIEDLMKADIVLSFTEDLNVKTDRPSKGGRHVEFGMGVALNKRMVVIGPREHVFHWLPNVEHYGSVNEFLDVLKEEAGHE